MKFTPEQEQQLAKELEEAGFMVTHDPRGWWIGLGSHGSSGYYPSLRKALKNCLNCCGIWKYWKLPDARMAIDVAKELCIKHLGSYK